MSESKSVHADDLHVPDRSRYVGGTCMISFVLLLIILPIFIVGFACPDWVHVTTSNYTDTFRVGLWQVCYSHDGERTCNTFQRDDRDAWSGAVVTLMTCSLMIAVIGAAIAMILPITAGLQMLSGMLGIIGVIVFAAEVDYGGVSWHLEWAFYLCAVASTLLLLNGCCFLVLAFMTDWSMSVHNPCKRHRRVHAHTHAHSHFIRIRTRSEIQRHHMHHMAHLPKRVHRNTISDFRSPEESGNTVSTLQPLPEQTEPTTTTTVTTTTATETTTASPV